MNTRIPRSGTRKNPVRRAARSASRSSDDGSLIASNLLRSVDERLRRHDAALNDLLALRAAVRKKDSHG